MLASIGYAVNYESARRFAGNPQVASAFGAMAIALIANFNTRFGPRIWQFWERAQEYRNRRRHQYVRKGSLASDESGDSGLPSPSDIEMQPQAQPNPKKRLRVDYHLAAAAMLPAIFVLVPSGKFTSDMQRSFSLFVLILLPLLATPWN